MPGHNALRTYKDGQLAGIPPARHLIMLPSANPELTEPAPTLSLTPPTGLTRVHCSSSPFPVLDDVLRGEEYPELFEKSGEVWSTNPPTTS